MLWLASVAAHFFAQKVERNTVLAFGVECQRVYRTSTALRKNGKLRLDFQGVLGFGKEHHGRNVFYFK